MKRCLFKVFAVFLFIGVSPAWLYGAEFLHAFPHSAYHELMSGGQPVGKTSFNWGHQKGLYHFVENSMMKVKLFKKEYLIETKLQVYTNPQLEVQKFVYYMLSPDSKLEVKGTRVGSNIRLEKIQSGSKQLKYVPIQEPMLMSPLIRPFLLMKKLPLGKKKEENFNALLLEPSAFKTLPMNLKVKQTPSKKKKLWELAVSYLGHVMTSRIDQEGRLLSENTDLGGLKIVAKPIMAKTYAHVKITGTKQDLVEWTKVPYGDIPNARTRKELKVKISGFAYQNFQLNRHRQSLKGNALTIRVEKIPTKTEPAQSLVGKKEFEHYLAVDIAVPVYNPIIQKTASKIIGKENDLWKRALLIHKFVYSHLKNDPYISLPDALEALETGEGDCNEHSVLYTALARAAGVPARIVVGLVYANDGSGHAGFYYHAWVEVYTGNEWIAIDPTWDQVPADATHIAFVEGGVDEQIQIAALMGKIKLSSVHGSAAVR